MTVTSTLLGGKQLVYYSEDRSAELLDAHRQFCLTQVGRVHREEPPEDSDSMCLLD